MLNTNEVTGSWHNLTRLEAAVVAMLTLDPQEKVRVPKRSATTQTDQDLASSEERIGQQGEGDRISNTKHKSEVVKATGGSHARDDVAVPDEACTPEGSRLVLDDLDESIADMIMTRRKDEVVRLQKELPSLVTREGGKIIVRGMSAETVTRVADRLRALGKELRGISPSGELGGSCSAKVAREGHVVVLSAVPRDIAEQCLVKHEMEVLRLAKKFQCDICLEDDTIVIRANSQKSLNDARRAVHDLCNEVARPNAHSGGMSSDPDASRKSNGFPKATSSDLWGGQDRREIGERHVSILSAVPKSIAEQCLVKHEMEVLRLCKTFQSDIRLEDGTIVIRANSEKNLNDARRAVHDLCNKVTQPDNHSGGGTSDADAARGSDGFPNAPSSSLWCGGDRRDNEVRMEVNADGGVLRDTIRRERAVVKTLEKKHQCRVDLGRSPDGKVVVSGSSRPNVEAAIEELKRLCHGDANSAGVVAADGRKPSMYKDQIQVIPPLLRILRNTAKAEVNDILLKHGAEMKPSDQDSKITFQAVSKDALQACMEEFVTLYQSKMSLMKHSVVRLEKHLPKQAVDELLHQANMARDGCTASINADKDEITLYGLEHDVQSVRFIVEDMLSSGELLKRPSLYGNRDQSIYHGSPPPHSPAAGEKRSVVVGSVRLEIITGNITRQEVDAIVNAANDRLAHGAGVAGAIVDAGGPSIQAESNRLMAERGYPLRTGDAVHTRAGRLLCSYVIHAVGPIWSSVPRDLALRQLADACRHSLQQAHELCLTSVAFPAISSGIYGMPKDQCAKIMLESIAMFCRTLRPSSCLRLVRIVLFEPAALRAFLRVFDEMFASPNQIGASGRTSLYSPEASRPNPQPQPTHRSGFDRTERGMSAPGPHSGTRSSGAKSYSAAVMQRPWK